MDQKTFVRAVPAMFVVLATAFLLGTMMVAGPPATTQDGSSLATTGSLDGDLGSSAVTATNQYTGTGSPLAFGEWADSKNTTTGLSFIGAGTGRASIRLAEGWDGMRIFTYLYNLKDIESWTRNPATTFDGTANTVNNFGGSPAWTYGEVDPQGRATGADNAGNYLVADINPALGGLGTQWAAGSTGYWQQSMTVPRGTISRMWVAFDYWAGTKDQDASGTQDPFCPWDMVKIYANVGSAGNIANSAQRVVEIPSGQIPNKNNAWNPTGLRAVPQSIVDAINSGSPTPGNPVVVRVGILNSEAYSTNVYNGLTRFRNIRVFIEALAQPVQLNLRVSFDGVGGNGGTQNAIQNVGTTYGVGQLNYTATPSRWLAGAIPLDINSTLVTNATVQFPADALETVAFDMYQVIYGTNQKNSVTESNLFAGDGTVFSTANGSNSNWIFYFYNRPPQIPQAQDDYINYKFNGTKPSDWTITSVLDSQPVEKVANLTISGGGTRIEMPPSLAAYYGFWSFSANSPNYVQSVSTPAFLYEGENLRINGSIISSTLTDSYVGQTQAELVIKFPNGTVWNSAYRRTTVLGTRQFSFGSITIPTSGVDYVAGTYTAIITWNNSRSGLPLNETGCMTRTFTVRHRTTFSAANLLIYDVLNTQTALPIQLRYADTGGALVPGATVSFTNFDSALQTFTFVNDFYNYLTLLDCTNGPRGLKYFNITASHPAYETKSLMVGVEIVRTSNFTTANASVSIQWNNNFDLVFSYIDATNGSGIVIDSPSNITVVGWPGGTSRFSVDTSQATLGTYRLTFNTSSTLPDRSYPITISIKKIGCQGKTIATDVSITPRSSTLNLIPVPDIPFGVPMVVNANFREVSSGSLITGATTTAQIVGHGACSVASFPNGTYRYGFDTSTLPSTGTYSLRVVMNWSGVPYYANQTQTLSIRVIQRSTQAYATETFDVKYWGSIFNVSLFYIDVVDGSSIGGSNVVITISAFDGATPLGAVNTGTLVLYNGTSGPWILTFNASHFGRTNLSPGFSVSVTIGWQVNAAPYYMNRSVAFVLKIDEAPTFLYIRDPSRQTVPSGNNHTVTFTLINQRTGLGIPGQEGNIVVTSAGILPDSAIFNPAIGISADGLGNYTLMFNITKLSSDYVTFNISIDMSYYVDITNYTFTLIKITPIPVTEVEPVAPVHLDQQVNISIYFHLVGVSAGIPDAAISLQSNPTSSVWITGSYTAAYDGSKFYNILFTPSFSHTRVNASGSYSVFVNLTSSSGNSQVRVNFVVNPIPTNISLTYFNGTDYTSTLPTYVVFIGDFVNVSVYFENTFNSSVVTGATVTISRSGFSQALTRSGTMYYYVVNTGTFGVGSFEFTISASRNNFLQASQKVKLDIQPVSTDLVVKLNNSASPNFVMYYGESMVIAFLYNNTHRNVAIRTGSAIITGGTATFTNSTFSVNATGWWIGTVSSSGIGVPGTYSLTLSVSLASYQTAIETIIVTIYTIPTDLASYNSTGHPQESFTVYWGGTVSLALRYMNTLTSTYITGASMSVTGSLANSTFTTTGTWYNYTFNTTPATPRTYSISISSFQANHASDTVLITITVLPIPTELLVYDGNVLSTSYEAVFGQNVTFKLQFRNTLDSSVVLGPAFSSSFGFIAPTPGESGNYTMAVNTTSWTAIGIVQFTITATRANHVAASEVVTINIKPITTDVRVYINGVDRTDTLQETINFLESFSVTVYFNNTLAGSPITGATVQLAFTNGTGSYTLGLPAAGAPGNYSNTFDSGFLGSVIGNQYIFDLSATRANFQPVFKRINIFYNPIPTSLNVTNADGNIHLSRSGANNSVTVIHCDTVQLLVNLTSYLQGMNLSGPGVSISAVINQQTIAGTYSMALQSYLIDIQVNTTVYGLTAGLTHQVLIIGEASGYKGDTFSILLRVLPIPTQISVAVNGTMVGQSGVVNRTVYLYSKLEIFAWYSDAYQPGNLNLTSAQVVLTFFNSYTSTQESVPLPREFLQDYFRCEITMDPTLLIPGTKDFYITATFDNYETKTFKLIVNVLKIPVITKLDVTTVGLDTVSVIAGDSFTLRVVLFENITRAPFLNLSTITVTLLTDFNSEEIQMQPERDSLGQYTGAYTCTLTAPTSVSSYLLRIRVSCSSPYLRDQFQFSESTTFTLDVNPREGPPVWLIYILLGAILVISVWFILYQVRFKYPPMIRKIMDMRRAVARSREAAKIHPAKVMSREENIYSHFAKMINSFSFLQTRDTRYAAKGGGYAPVPDESTKLEWEIQAIEAPEMPQAEAKGLKKARGYVAPEGVAPAFSPAKPIAEVPAPAATTMPTRPVVPAASPAQPPAGGVPVPAAKPVVPAVPGPATVPVAKPVVKPTGLTALPKPSVAPLKAVRPGMPGVKPTPGTPGAAAAPGVTGGESHENLYQQLVLLEQKRYKAERSMRDLDAKHSKGLISDDEFRSYQEKISGGLDKIKQQIADIRRKLISF